MGDALPNLKVLICRGHKDVTIKVCNIGVLLVVNVFNYFLYSAIWRGVQTIDNGKQDASWSKLGLIWGDFFHFQKKVICVAHKRLKCCHEMRF